MLHNFLDEIHQNRPQCLATDENCLTSLTVRHTYINLYSMYDYVCNNCMYSLEMAHMATSNQREVF